jgi:hypothetical protein
MDEAGVVKQTTTEQVIQSHQLSTKSTVLSKKERFPSQHPGTKFPLL